MSNAAHLRPPASELRVSVGDLLDDADDDAAAIAAFSSCCATADMMANARTFCASSSSSSTSVAAAAVLGEAVLALLGDCFGDGFGDCLGDAAAAFLGETRVPAAATAGDVDADALPCFEAEEVREADGDAADKLSAPAADGVAGVPGRRSAWIA